MLWVRGREGGTSNAKMVTCVISGRGQYTSRVPLACSYGNVFNSPSSSTHTASPSVSFTTRWLRDGKVWRSPWHEYKRGVLLSLEQDKMRRSDHEVKYMHFNFASSLALYTTCVVDAPDAVSTAAGRAADQMARDHARIMENRKL